MATRRMLVHGRVQQVGFRAFVRRRARRLGLGGLVRNTPAGAVEVVASGDPADLDQLEEFLRQGPPLAIVGAVDSAPAAERKFEGFEVVA